MRRLVERNRYEIFRDSQILRSLDESNNADHHTIDIEPNPGSMAKRKSNSPLTMLFLGEKSRES
jgi:hypothetical protein